MSASVKVPTSTILKAAKAELATLIARRATRTATNKQNEAARQGAIMASLRAAVKNGGKGAQIGTSGYPRHSNVVSVPLTVKLKPLPQWNWQDDNRIAAIEGDIKLLEATSQTDITVRSGSNFAQYI